MRWIVIILCGLSVSACALSSGTQTIRNETEASLASKIARGKTTKEEVNVTFGTPSLKTITESGNEQWIYTLKEGSSDALNNVPLAGALAQTTSVRTKMITFLFDRGGRVANYTISESSWNPEGVEILTDRKGAAPARSTAATSVTQ